MLIRIHVKLHTWFHPTQGCACRTCMGFVNGNDLHHRKLCTSHTVPPSEDAPSVPACVLHRAHKRVIGLAGYARVTQLLYSNSRRWLPQRAHTVIAAVTFGPCFGFRPPPSPCRTHSRPAESCARQRQPTISCGCRRRRLPCIACSPSSKAASGTGTGRGACANSRPSARPPRHRRR